MHPYFVGSITSNDYKIKILDKRRQFKRKKLKIFIKNWKFPSKFKISFKIDNFLQKLKIFFKNWKFSSKIENFPHRVSTTSWDYQLPFTRLSTTPHETINYPTSLSTIPTILSTTSQDHEISPTRLSTTPMRLSNSPIVTIFLACANFPRNVPMSIYWLISWYNEKNNIIWNGVFCV